MKYNYSYALDSGVALGGIGTGIIEIKADGRLYNWSIFNNGFFTTLSEYRRTYYLTPRDFAFFVRVKDSNGRIKVRVLQAYDYYYAGSPYTFPWVRPIKGIEFNGEPPFAFLEYKDDDLPVNITLEAFSPLIPGDLKNSTIPVAIFKFVVEAKDDVEISLLSLLRSPFELTEVFVRSDGFSIVPRELSQNDPRYWGSMSLSAIVDQGKIFAGAIRQQKDIAPSYHDSKELIDILIQLRSKGYVEVKELLKAEKDIWGFTGAMKSLKKGEKTEIYFILGWYFPNHIDNYGERLGHYYERFFGYSEDVVNYVKQNLKYLEEKTRKFHDILYNPEGVEKWIADLAGAQLSTLLKGTWLTKDGTFAWWEGIWESYSERTFGNGYYYDGPMNNALNTTDVMLYALLMLVSLFPELAKNYVKRQYSYVLKPDNPMYILYVLSIPENLQEYRKLLQQNPEISTDLEKLRAAVEEIVKKTGKDPKYRAPHFFSKSIKRVDQYHMISNVPELVISAHLVASYTGDLDMVKELIDTMLESMRSIERTSFINDLPYHTLPSGIDWINNINRMFNDLDPFLRNFLISLLGNSSVPIGFTTYDVWSWIGHSAYVSILWTAALKSLITLTKLLNRQKDYEELDIKYKKAIATINSELWNGTYFRAWKDPISGLQDDFIVAAQLVGEYFAKILNLGYITSKEQVRATLKTIFENNYFDEEGLINGIYPGAERPAFKGEMRYEFNIPLLPGYHADTPWSGIEFMVASHMIYESMVNEAKEILKNIKERYEVAGHFWNHVEWGAGYMRPASAWGLIHAFEGLVYDGLSKTIYISPKAEKLKWLFAVSGNWGIIEYNNGKVRIQLEKGNLTLNKIYVNDKLVKEGEIVIKEGESIEI